MDSLSGFPLSNAQTDLDLRCLHWPQLQFSPGTTEVALGIHCKEDCSADHAECCCVDFNAARRPEGHGDSGECAV